MQRPTKPLGKLSVTHRLWCAGIIGTAGVVTLQEKIDQADLIGDMNPWHPLPPIANRPTQAEFEWQSQARQKTALTGQHQPGSHQHDANTQGLGLLRRFFPGNAQLAGEILFDRPPRAAGKTKWNYWKLFNLAIDGITSFTTAPLRIAAFTGCFLAIVAAIYLVMPIRRVRPSHALIGGFTATALWEIVRHILVWYFTTLSKASIVYGSFATAVIMLLSMEVAATLLLLGAQVIAEYERIGQSE